MTKAHLKLKKHICFWQRTQFSNFFKPKNKDLTTLITQKWTYLTYTIYLPHSYRGILLGIRNCVANFDLLLTLMEFFVRQTSFSSTIVGLKYQCLWQHWWTIFLAWDKYWWGRGRVLKLLDNRCILCIIGSYW